MQFTPEGELLRTIGTPNEPGETDHNFNKPTGIAFTPSGDFFVTDGYGNSRVVKFSKDYFPSAIDLNLAFIYGEPGFHWGTSADSDNE